MTQVFGSSGASQDATPPPPLPKAINEHLHTEATPFTSSQYLFFFSRFPVFSLCEGCLKGHDSIFNCEQLRGPSPGRLAGNEGRPHCARCFSALRFCRWEGGGASSSCHTPHTHVYLHYETEDTSYGRPLEKKSTIP